MVWRVVFLSCAVLMLGWNLACDFETVTITPKGWANITVHLVNAYPNLQLRWSGRWVRATDQPLAAGEATPSSTGDVRSIVDGVAGQSEEFVTLTLRSGVWEFVISGSVAGADPFLPVVCRQEIRTGQPVLLEVTEGQLSCTSRSGGGEASKLFLWGQVGTGFSLAGHIARRRSEAYPDAATGTGDMNYAYLLVRAGTNLTRAPSIKIAFYDHVARRGSVCVTANCPVSRISDVVNVNVLQQLRDRQHTIVEAATGEELAAGNSWIFFELQTPAPVISGQTYSIGLLDYCADASFPCDATAQFFTVSGALRNSFQNPVGGETDLPNPWPVTSNTTLDAPLAAFGLHREGP